MDTQRVDLLVFLPAVFVFVFVGILFLVAYNRKGSVATVQMSKRRLVVQSPAPPQVVYGWLVQHCPGGYAVEDHDPSRGIVLLSSRPSAFTWGFFYPAVVSADGAGTRVDLGIKSKAFQYGPLVTRAHRKLAGALAGLVQGRVAE
ncbi:hypothetical protein NLX83_04055 [Allokutzneria sp. A3M-2-11 16]|uniref:hypothetical protein n=1 Tax=Allokutzneria sp. A3M-2-11 16 TaxID=2962043 RepID=UPI0020B76BD2|nr:hypothetical protein [Allokutzneria sp. A3M-2-11 16]MCP3798427.1 hypothetical protein [Allokutzneria sp. A3M-2-11 16]